MINSLTSFRFITAFIVFLFHCDIGIGLDLGKFINRGAVFMTGFFVLSGFIMTHVYQNWDFSDKKNIYQFYLKRFAKIYPAYIVATIAYFCIESDFNHKEWIRIISNDIFLTQAFFPSMFSLGMNAGTWSLSVEAFLYFLFPFLFILCGKSSKLIWVVLILGVLVTINEHYDKGAHIYANPVMRLADFLSGIAFYNLKEKEIFKKNWFQALVVTMLIIVTIATKRFYMSHHVFVIMLFGAWVACVYHSKSIIYNNKILIYLGLISYSFYLWQFLAIKIGKEFLVFGVYWASIVALILNIIFSIISYHILEEKFRKLIIKKNT